MSAALIHVRFDRVGFHRWPDAPAHRKYLRERHRHLFKVEVTTAVKNDEREIEYHDLMEVSRISLDRVLGLPEACAWSCERMARELGAQLKASYKRDFTVEVWEDGECGSTVST